MIPRRVALSLVSAIGFAGCTSFSLSKEEAQLGGVILENPTSGARTIRIRIRADGERVHASSHAVESGEMTEMECGWSSNPASFEIEARRDDADWHSLDLSEAAKDGCHFVSVRARERPYLDDIEFDVRPCDDLVDGFGCEFRD